MKAQLLTAALGCWLAGTGYSADWPQFRGPGGTGVSTESNLPTEWSETKNVAWKAPIKGVAWSCPIVVGDSVVVTTAIADGQPKPGGGGGFGGGGRPPMGGGARPPMGGGGRGPDKEYTWKVVCLDRMTGKEVWATTANVGKPKYGTHGSNTFATETPVSDGSNIYAYFAATGTVIALDMAGKEVWKVNIGAYPMMANWGTASSPTLHNGKLIVQCDNEEKSFVVALNVKDGKEAWKISRSEKTVWSSPYIWKTKDRTDLVVIGTQKVRGYDPETGKEVWSLGVGGGGQANTTPVGDDNLLYVGTSIGGGGGGGRPGGFGGGGARPGGVGMASGGAAGTLYAVKPGVKGDITLKEGANSNDGVAWAASKAMPSASSPIIYEGYVYLFDRQGGTVSCYNAKTGKAEYTKERLQNAQAFWSSPFAYGGKVFCMDSAGVTHVIKAGPSFEAIGKNSLGKDVYWSTPAIASGGIFLRGVDALYCIR